MKNRRGAGCGRGPAAERDDRRLGLIDGEPEDDRFRFAPGVLAPFLETGRRIRAAVGFGSFVEVDEGAGNKIGRRATGGGFAGAAKADQDQVHSGIRVRWWSTACDRGNADD